MMIEYPIVDDHEPTDYDAFPPDTDVYTYELPRLRATTERIIALQRTVAHLTQTVTEFQHAEAARKAKPEKARKAISGYGSTLLFLFAGQTADRATIAAKLGLSEAITKRAIFEVWSAGKARYTGGMFVFQAVTA